MKEPVMSNPPDATGLAKELRALASKCTPGTWIAATRQGSWDWVLAVEGTPYEICQMFHDGTDLNERGEANTKFLAFCHNNAEAIARALTPDGEPVAWAYELAARVRIDGEPAAWFRALSFDKPNVTERMIRNLRPLYARALTQPPPAAGLVGDREAAMRAIMGAIKSAHDAHPGMAFDFGLAPSIAKRVVGALSTLPTPEPPAEREGWQPIETAPKGMKIIAGYLNSLGKWRTILACYYPAGTLDNSEYSDTDDEFAPEGWYEEGEAYCENLQPVDRTPTHWMPLPEPPLAARPKGGAE